MRPICYGGTTDNNNDQRRSSSVVGETGETTLSISTDRYHHLSPYIALTDYEASVLGEDFLMGEAVKNSANEHQTKPCQSSGRKESSRIGSSSKSERKSLEKGEAEQLKEWGLVVRPTTIAKVAEEFNWRREQVRNLSDALKDKETLTIKLQTDLSRVQNDLLDFRSTAQDVVLRHRAAATQQVEQMKRQVESKDEQIDYYEFKLRALQKEMEELRQVLISARRREFELEIQLEIHDFKFSSYENYQRQVDTEALEKIGGGGGGNSDEEGPIQHYDDKNNNDESTKQYIRKLVSDLDEMEQQYVRSKIDAADKISTLGEELQCAEAHIERLENRILAYRKMEQSFDSGGGDTAPMCSFDSDPDLLNLSASASSEYSGDGGGGGTMGGFVGPTIENLKKSMEYLEAQNAQFLSELRRLRDESVSIRSAIREKEEVNARELASLRLENEALIHKIAALQIESGLSSGSIDDSTRLKRYKMLEQNLDEYIVDIMRFEDQLRTKDRVISRLSSQLLERRVAISAQEDSPIKEDLDSSSNNTDGKSAKSRQQQQRGDSQRTKATAEETLASTTNNAELESELEAVRAELGKKDELLSYVRANYSAKVATLKLQLEKDSQPIPKQKSDLYFI